MISKEESAITSDELLARYVLSSSWIRQADQTVKQDAFIPHPESRDVSVTRHKGISDRQIWGIGEMIASNRNKKLQGRADLSDTSVERHSLEIKPDPVPGNPNHAIIINWPADKAAQKSIAQQLAATSTFRKKTT